MLARMQPHPNAGLRNGSGMLDAQTSGRSMNKAVLALVAMCVCPTAFAASVISTRLDDPKAIYLAAPATTGDSSVALQAAIDKASGTGREGIVFVQEGRYNL